VHKTLHLSLRSARQIQHISLNSVPLKTHFNINLPSTPRFFKISLPLRFPDPNRYMHFSLSTYSPVLIRFRLVSQIMSHDWYKGRSSLAWNFLHSPVTLYLLRLRPPLPRHPNIYIYKLRGLSLQANYNDRATTACRQSWCQPLRVEGVAWSVQRIPTAVNLGFLDRSRYFFIQVAPHLSSWGRAGLWICSQKLLTTRPQSRSPSIYMWL
jgi:hypothetical protein